MGVKITATYAGGLSMRLVHGPSATTIFTDPPVDNGGEGKSFSPTDMVAAAYGACMMSMVALRAKKDGLSCEGMSIVVEKHMSAAPPRKIERLDVDFTLPSALPSESREAYITAAKECPVARSIHPDIDVKIHIRS